MQAILDDAVAAYERSMFWASFEAGYDRLADHSGSWRDVEAERSGEANSLADDLDDT